jgi:hypothetical protein
MTNKKHKKCGSCKAYEYHYLGKYAGFDSRCSLGFEQIKGVPQEKCPKPLSVEKFVKLLSQKVKV